MASAQAQVVEGGGEPSAAVECQQAAKEVSAASETLTTPLRMPDLVRSIREELQGKSGVPLHKREALKRLLERYDHSCEDWKRFVLFDEYRYTRNLVATDHKTFTLLLLCWNKGQESHVHDHPCDGCWVKVMHGTVKETRYHTPEEGGALQEAESLEASAGDITFINDSIALHKLGNPRSDDVAVTLHLYAPPFQQCTVWLDPSDASKVITPTMVHHSEHGHLVRAER